MLKLINLKKFHVDRDEFVLLMSKDPMMSAPYGKVTKSSCGSMEHFSLVDMGNARLSSAGMPPAGTGGD